MNFKVNFINKKKGKIIIDKPGRKVGLNDLEFIISYVEVNKLMEPGTLTIDNLNTGVIRGGLYKLKDESCSCTISVQLARTLNEKFNNAFHWDDTLDIKIKGSLNKYVEVNYDIDVEHCLLKSVIVRYKVNEDKLLNDWKDAGFPQLWNVGK